MEVGGDVRQRIAAACLLPFLKTKIDSAFPGRQPLACGATPGLGGGPRNLGASSCLFSASRQAQSVGPNWDGARVPRSPCPCHCRSRPGRTALGAAFSRSPHALLVLKRSGRQGGQWAVSDPQGWARCPEPGLCGAWSIGFPSQLPPGLALSARKPHESFPVPSPERTRASFHLIRMFLPSD